MARGIVINHYSDHEGDFYLLMGPFFANRKYAQEFGGWQFYTKDKADWFVATLNGRVAGFCCAIHEKTHIWLDNMYVVKGYRELGISKLLFEKRLEVVAKYLKPLRCICENQIHEKTLLKNNFNHTGFRGRYKKYEKTY